MPYRMFLFVVGCQNGPTQPWLCFHSVLAASYIVSHEPTIRARSSGLRTVPIMDCAVRSHELCLERFASTTAIAMVHLGCGLRSLPCASTTAISSACFT